MTTRMARSISAAIMAVFVWADSLSADSFLLTDATVHTVSGETLSPGQVLVREGKIAAVGKSVDGAGAQVIGLKGQHLYPGLIAATTSLGLVEISAVRSTRDTAEVGEYLPDVQSWIAINPDSELIPVARANGITHALPVPAGGIVTGQSGLIQLTGWTMDEMTIRKPAALHLFWPSMDLDLAPREKVRDRSKWKSPEDQARERQAKIKALEDFFDEARAYAKMRETAGKDGNASAGINPAWEGMLPFVRGQIPLMVHANDVRQIKAAVNWAASHNYKMILAGGMDAWMVAGLLASNNVPVIYEHTFTFASNLGTDRYDAFFRAPEILHRAGVKVIFSEGLGGDKTTNLRNLPYAAAQAVAFGLPEAEALKGMTLYPAQILGVADRLGSLEAGKEATLFAADGNIMDLRASVKRLWIGGQEISLETRHTRLYEKYKARPRSY